MLYSISTVFAFATLVSCSIANQKGPIGLNPNPKRGLVYVPNSKTTQDDKIWTQKDTPITWYYNYQSKPSSRISSGATKLQFVPMLWGDYDNTFISDVKNLIASGQNITYELWNFPKCVSLNFLRELKLTA